MPLSSACSVDKFGAGTASVLSSGLSMPGENVASLLWLGYPAGSLS